jgi:hypothetical protein
MEELAAEVDARDIGGDMIDEFAIAERRSRAGGELQRTIVDGGDEPSPEEDASRGGAIEEMVLCE